jgi:hypothetical protein
MEVCPRSADVGIYWKREVYDKIIISIIRKTYMPKINKNMQDVDVPVIKTRIPSVRPADMNNITDITKAITKAYYKGFYK